QALKAVHHPGDIAYTGDDLRVRKEIEQGRQLGTPHAIGVEYDRLVGAVGVPRVEKAAQQTAAHRRIYYRPKLAVITELIEHAGEQCADGARHAGMKARMLAQ